MGGTRGHLLLPVATRDPSKAQGHALSSTEQHRAHPAASLCTGVAKRGTPRIPSHPQPRAGQGSAAPCFCRASTGKIISTAGRRVSTQRPASLCARGPASPLLPLPPPALPAMKHPQPHSGHPSSIPVPRPRPSSPPTSAGKGVSRSGGCVRPRRLGKLRWPRLPLALPSLSASPNPLCNLLMHGPSSCLRHGKSRIMRASSPPAAPGGFGSAERELRDEGSVLGPGLQRPCCRNAATPASAAL